MSAPVYITPRNNAGSALAYGEIVRANGNNTCTRALASSFDGIAGVLGPTMAGSAVGVGGPVNVAVSGGPTPVLLETGLTPVAGQIVYVSGVVAGRGTTTPPATAAAVGIIVDASMYSRTSRVAISVQPVVGAVAGTTQAFELDVRAPIDPTIVADYTITLPSGYYFLASAFRSITVQLNGTPGSMLTSSCTSSVGNDAGKTNIIASGANTFGTTANINLSTPPFQTGGTISSLGPTASMVNTSTPFSLAITVGAVLNTATIYRIRCWLIGSMVPV